MTPPKLAEAPQAAKEAFVAQANDTPPAPAAKPKHRHKVPAASKRGVVARAGGREVRRVVLYIEPELYRRVRVACAQADVDVSDFAAEALEHQLRA